MGSLIIHTIAWVVVNIFVAVFFASSSSLTTVDSDINLTVSNSSSIVDSSDFDDIPDLQADWAVFGLPIWLVAIFYLLDSLWITAIIVGWLRGTS